MPSLTRLKQKMPDIQSPAKRNANKVNPRELVEREDSTNDLLCAIYGETEISLHEARIIQSRNVAKLIHQVGQEGVNQLQSSIGHEALSELIVTGDFPPSEPWMMDLPDADEELTEISLRIHAEHNTSASPDQLAA